MTESPTPKESFFGPNLEFKSFLLAFGESASRARRLINLLSIATIATLLGLSNSLRSSMNWFPSRIERMHEISQMAVFPNDSSGRGSKSNDSIIIVELDATKKATVNRRQNRFTAEEFREIISKRTLKIKDSIYTKLNAEVEVVPWIQYKFPSFVLDSNRTLNDSFLLKHSKLIVSAYNMLSLATFSSRTELDRYIQSMNRSKLENSIFVRMPLLGIAFDVNWLIIASGLGFLIIYFLLYYSLNRERKNIFLLFAIAKKETISLVGLYQYMSMQQVFTIPYSIDEVLDDTPKNDVVHEKATNKFKRVLPKILWCTPLLVWLFIFWYDKLTSRIGKYLNPSLLSFQSILNIIIGSLLLYITYICIKESVLIDKIWKKQSEIIRKAKATSFEASTKTEENKDKKEDQPKKNS